MAPLPRLVHLDARALGSRSSHWLLAAAGWVATCFGAAGCSAHADIPEVVVTQSDIAFDGVPRIPGVTDVTTTLETSFDHPEGVGLPEAFNPKLYPLSAKVVARGDMQDLSFLEGLSLQLASRAPDAPAPRIVASYTRKSSGNVGNEIDLTTDKDSDVLDYWGTKSAYYTVKIWGILPEQNWAIDATVSFSGELSVSAN